MSESESESALCVLPGQVTEEFTSFNEIQPSQSVNGWHW